MIAGLLWMALANAGVCMGSLALLSKVRTGRPGLDLVLFVILRVTLISAAVLAAGWAGILTGTTLGIAGTLVVVVRAASRRPAFSWAPFLPAADRITKILAALLAARLLGQVWFFSPFEADTLSYHLPKVGEWVQSGRIGTELGLDARAWLPAGLELIETWWVLFLHHDVLIQMGGVEFLFLAFAGARALALEAGFSDRSSSLCGLAYALAPGLQAQAVGCLNDGAVAALWVATAALIWGRAHPALLAAAAGLGLGTKPTFALAIPGLLLLAWFARRNPSPSAPPARLYGWALGGAGIFLGAHWYVRNLIVQGNPLFPVGLPAPGSAPQEVGPRSLSLLRNLNELLGGRVLDSSAPISPMLGTSAGWGPALVACGIVGLAAALRERSPLRALGAAYALSLVSVLSQVNWDPWSFRFILFFPSLLALAAVALAENHALFRRLLATLLGVHLLLGTFYDGHSLDSLAAREFRDRWRDRGALRDLPEGTVGCLAGYGSATYQLYGPDFSRRVVYLRVATVDELRTALRERGIRWIHAPVTLDHPELREIVEEAARRGLLVRDRPDRFLVP